MMGIAKSTTTPAHKTTLYYGAYQRISQASPMTPHQGLRPLSPLEAPPPDPRYRLALHALAMAPATACSPNFQTLPTPMSASEASRNFFCRLTPRFVQLLLEPFWPFWGLKPTPRQVPVVRSSSCSEGLNPQYIERVLYTVVKSLPPPPSKLNTALELSILLASLALFAAAVQPYP